MYKFFIGCDMSQQTFDVAFTKDDSPQYLGSFPNTPEGFTQVIQLLKSKTKITESKWFICYENTGVESLDLTNWLSERKIPFREESPLQLKRSLGIRRAKTDKMDAVDICKYCFEKRDSIKVSPPNDQLLVSVKGLLAKRRALVKSKTALGLSNRATEKMIGSQLVEELFDVDKQLFENINAQIKSIEKMIAYLIRANKKVYANYQLATSVCGIGPIIGAYLIVTTNNFSSFSNARQYCSYAGIAPFPNQSGKYNRGNRVSHIANKKMKAIIGCGVTNAIRFDPQLNSYHKRKIEAGKNNGQVRNAIKNKLIQRVFAVVKRQTPYVKIRA